MIKRLAISGIAILGVLVPVCCSTSPSAQAAGTPDIWIYPKAGLAAAANDTKYPSVYSKLVTENSGETVYEVINPVVNTPSCQVPGNEPPITGSNPNLFGTTHAYSGYGATAGSVFLPNTTTVLLDQESWCQTSPQDKADPYDNYRTIAKAVPSGDLLAAPALDLFSCPAGSTSCVKCPPASELPSTVTCKQCQPGTAPYQCYLDYDIAGMEALHSAVIDIQAQSLESVATPSGGAKGPHWDTFVSTAITQAKAANPEVKILVGLTNRSSLDPTAEILEGDLQDALNQGASGAWINEDSGGSAGLMDQVVSHFI